MNVTMWIVGSIIFIVYMYFTIWNINNGSKQTKPNARKKKKTVRRQLVDDRKSRQVLFGFLNILPYIHNRKLRKWQKK